MSSNGNLGVTGGSVKLYLFLLILIFALLVAGLLFWVKNNSDNFKKSSSQDQSSGVSADIGKTVGFQKKALEENKTYSGYVALFDLTLSDYKVAPNDQRRKSLEDLQVLAKKDFPNEFNQADFIIPCIDEKKCISGLEPEVVVVLISEVKASAKSSNLENMAVQSLVALGSYETSEESKAIVAYNQAYKNCVTVLDQDKANDKLKAAIINFENLIAEKFPNKYQFYKAQDVYKLTNENVQAQ